MGFCSVGTAIMCVVVIVFFGITYGLADNELMNKAPSNKLHTVIVCKRYSLTSLMFSVQRGECVDCGDFYLNGSLFLPFVDWCVGSSYEIPYLIDTLYEIKACGGQLLFKCRTNGKNFGYGV